jgi:hypothetical protein
MRNAGAKPIDVVLMFMIGMINLVYNMKRLVQLIIIMRDALAANLRYGYIRRGAFAAPKKRGIPGKSRVST